MKRPFRKAKLDAILVEARKRRMAMVWSPSQNEFVGYVYLTKTGKLVNPREHDLPC